MSSTIKLPQRDDGECDVQDDKRVVLLMCGSFSPVTLSHIAVLERARRALEALGYPVKCAYLSAVHDGYGKTGLVCGKHRTAMLRVATAHMPWITVDDWEVSRDAASPSYSVAEHVATLEKGRVMFVCGADLAIAMTDPMRWPPINVRRLVSAATIAVIRRAGQPDPPRAFHDVDDVPRSTITLDDDAAPLAGSSTEVRGFVARGETFEHLVHADVSEYIRRHGLFST